MKKPLLHFFQHEDSSYCFAGESLRLIRFAPEFASKIEGILAGKIEAAEASEDVQEALSTLAGLSPAPFEQEKADGPTVYLNLVNACNLKCVYCYANGGTYASAPGVMDYSTSVQALDAFFTSHGRVACIVFFGGEPLLKADLIPKICDYAIELARLRNVPQPRFSIITNGLGLTSENVNVLAKYGFGVTVSIDGPKSIHDVLRPQINGSGSQSHVLQGLRNAQSAGLFCNVECTFTAEHLRRGIHPLDLVRFFREELGVKSLALSPVSSMPGQELSLDAFYEKLVPEYRKAVRYALESMLTENPIRLQYAEFVLPHLIFRKRKPIDKYCYTKIGVDHFAVSSRGNVYPCQMMTDREEFKMGNVGEKSFTELPVFKNAQARVNEMDRDHMQCKTCWAKGVCFMCLAGIEIETSGFKPIPKHRCDWLKGVVEETLLCLAEFQRDADKWNRFLKSYFGM